MPFGDLSAAAAANPALLEVLQNVATGVISASDGAVQLHGITSPTSTEKESAIEGPAAAGSRPRRACPEIVWGEGKSAEKILASLCHIAARQGSAAATRVSPEVGEAICARDTRVVHHPTARMLTLKTGTVAKLPGTVALICAGTASRQVVEECRLVLQAMGCYAFKLPESGVMGIHR